MQVARHVLHPVTSAVDIKASAQHIMLGGVLRVTLLGQMLLSSISWYHACRIIKPPWVRCWGVIGCPVSTLSIHSQRIQALLCNASCKHSAKSSSGRTGQVEPLQHPCFQQTGPEVPRGLQGGTQVVRRPDKESATSFLEHFVQVYYRSLAMGA